MKCKSITRRSVQSSTPSIQVRIVHETQPFARSEVVQHPYTMGSIPLLHVVMVPQTAPGHASPFLHFAKQLAACGVTVTFVSSDKHISRLGEALGTLDCTREGLPLRFLGLRDGAGKLPTPASPQEKIVNLFDPGEFLACRDLAPGCYPRECPEKEVAIRLLEELVTDVGSPESQKLRGVAPAGPPICILHDIFNTWVQVVADKLHIEKDLLFVSPVHFLAAYLQSERLAQEGRVPFISKDVRNSIISDIPGLPAAHLSDFPASFKNPVIYSWIKYHHYRLGRANAILVNSFYELEKEPIDALRNEVLATPYVKTEYLFDIGPLSSDVDQTTIGSSFGDSFVETLQPCLMWLDTQAPSSVLYICFGSQTVNVPSQVHELAMGLENSGQPFLWILRPSDTLPSGFEDRVKGRAMCYSGWAPQIMILNHPATGGFLSHCGWNSTLESVSAGVPMLTWSRVADQHLICRFLVDMAHVAMELQREPDEEKSSTNPVRFVRSEEIAMKVRRLMGEEGRSVRERMATMREAAAMATTPAGSSRRNLQAYVQLLLHRHTSASALQPVNNGCTPGVHLDPEIFKMSTQNGLRFLHL